MKLYTDIIKDFTYQNGQSLKDLSIKYSFLLYEGKFFNTDKTIFFNEFTGRYKLYKWVDIIDITFNHSSEIFNSIKYINKKNNKHTGVVYNSSKFNKGIIQLLDGIVIGSSRVFCKNIFRLGYRNDYDIILRNRKNFFLN